MQLSSDPICPSSGCKEKKYKGIPRNYFVPNFGIDEDIASTQKNIEDAEEAQESGVDKKPQPVGELLKKIQKAKEGESKESAVDQKAREDASEEAQEAEKKAEKKVKIKEAVKAAKAAAAEDKAEVSKKPEADTKKAEAKAEAVEKAVDTKTAAVKKEAAAAKAAAKPAASSKMQVSDDTML